MASLLLSGHGVSSIEVMVSGSIYGGELFPDSRVIPSISRFKADSDVTVSNRISEELNDVEEKGFLRYPYARDERNDCDVFWDY